MIIKGHLSQRLKCIIVITLLSVISLPSLTFHIFNFSSETTDRIERNLTWSKISTSSITFVFFEPNGKNKMACLASNCLKHFQLLLWNRWAEFDETYQETRSQPPLQSLYFFGGPTGKSIWQPWPLIGWDIFDFSSETAELNSTKLDRNQELNILYKVCIFRADQKKQGGHPGFWLAETFWTSPLKPLNGIQRNLTGSKVSTFSSSLCFSSQLENQNGCPGLWLAETFRLFLCNHWTEFNKT